MRNPGLTSDRKRVPGFRFARDPRYKVCARSVCGDTIVTIASAASSAKSRR
jgi:hypothetical protein